MLAIIASDQTLRDRPDHLVLQRQRLRIRRRGGCGAIVVLLLEKKRHINQCSEGCDLPAMKLAGCTGARLLQRTCLGVTVGLNT